MIDSLLDSGVTLLKFIIKVRNAPACVCDLLSSFTCTKLYAHTRTLVVLCDVLAHNPCKWWARTDVFLYFDLTRIYINIHALDCCRRLHDASLALAFKHRTAA